MNIDLDVSLEQLRRSRGSKWTTFGPDVLPAWVADMDFPIADPIRQAIVDTLDRGDLGYPGPTAIETLAEVFAQRMGEHFGWHPDPALVMPVGDLIQALIACTGTFSQPGEGVIVQTPIYPPFLQIVARLGRRLVDNRLIRGPDRYQMDIDALRSSMDKDTKLFLFCNPHNPTGRVFEREELEEIAALALAQDLIVIADEIHADLAYPGGRHIPLASLGPEIARRTITITSATKAFNIAGLKCALIHFGSKELMRQQTAFFAQHLLGTPNILGIEATLAAWTNCEEWLQAVLGQLSANRAMVTEFLATHLPLINCHPPQAGYLAWLDCSALELSARPYPHLLANARVAFSDGREFSKHSDDFVRLNFATTPAILTDILERTADALQR